MLIWALPIRLLVAEGHKNNLICCLPSHNNTVHTQTHPTCNDRGIFLLRNAHIAISIQNEIPICFAHMSPCRQRPPQGNQIRAVCTLLLHTCILHLLRKKMNTNDSGAYLALYSPFCSLTHTPTYTHTALMSFMLFHLILRRQLVLKPPPPFAFDVLHTSVCVCVCVCLLGHVYKQ